MESDVAENWVALWEKAGQELHDAWKAHHLAERQKEVAYRRLDAARELVKALQSELPRLPLSDAEMKALEAPPVAELAALRTTKEPDAKG